MGLGSCAVFAACCVLCVVCCVLCVVCCVLCAVCCVLCAVCCVLCAVCCVLTPPLPPSHNPKQLLFADSYPFVPPPGLPAGWIEVLDVEEPQDLPRGTRVLIDMREKGPGVPFIYGNIITRINKKKSVYLVRADLNGGTTMKVARSRIETIGRASFFTNLQSGESAWTVEQAAAKEVFPSRPMQVRLIASQLSRTLCPS